MGVTVSPTAPHTGEFGLCAPPCFAWVACAPPGCLTVLPYTLCECVQGDRCRGSPQTSLPASVPGSVYHLLTYLHGQRAKLTATLYDSLTAGHRHFTTWYTKYSADGSQYFYFRYAPAWIHCPGKTCFTVLWQHVAQMPCMGFHFQQWCSTYIAPSVGSS